MRYHGDHHVLPLFGPWRWAPYKRGNFHWKKYQNARSFFLSHTSKLNQQKQWEVVSKSTAKIYPSNKYNIFPSFIIDQSWNTLQLKNIVLSFHPPFEPINALFTFTGLWPISAINCKEIIEGSKIVLHRVLQNWLSALDVVLQACCIVCYDNIL